MVRIRVDGEFVKFLDELAKELESELGGSWPRTRVTRVLKALHSEPSKIVVFVKKKGRFKEIEEEERPFLNL